MSRTIDGVKIEELNCSYCNENIRTNGGYLMEVNGDYVCCESEKNADCWWAFMENYGNQIVLSDGVDDDLYGEEEAEREKNLDYAMDNMTNDLAYNDNIGEWVENETS